MQTPTLTATLLLIAAPLLVERLAAQSRDRMATIDTDAADVAVDLPQGRPDAFRAQWTHAGQRWTVDLRAHSVRAAEFRVMTADGTTRRELRPPASRTYRGSVAGQPRSIVAASLTDAGLTAAIYPAEGEALILQPVDHVDARRGTRGTHRFGPAPRLPHGFCGVASRPDSGGGGAPQLTTGGHRIAQIAFDVDHDYYQFRGASTTAVIADIEAAQNAVNAMYEREVDVSHRITHILIRTSEPDPYDGNDAGAILNAFRAEWNTNQTGVVRDTAHFITSRGMGNILGLAWVGVICSPDLGYGLSQFRNNFGTNISVLGHELGHNWSLPHCLDTCDIMCGCGIGGGFGPNDRAQLTSYRDSRTCLSSLYPELVAHYPLDESSGTSFVDVAGSGLNGTHRGGTSVGQPGASANTGNAATFDGTNDRGAIPTGAALDRLTANFSVAAWVRADRLSGRQRIFGSVNMWSVGLDGARPIVSFRGNWSRISTATIPATTWTHLAFVIDENQAATFYVDGVGVGTVNAPTVTPIAASEWFVGGRSDTSELFAGSIDDLQIYDGTLSAGQARFLHRNPGATLCTPETESYGSGLMGSRSVPTLTLEGIPLAGESLTLTISNSTSLLVIPAALFVGTGPASIPFFGGTVLVDPIGATVIPFTLLPVQGDFTLRVPAGSSCGEAYLQAVELDPGAAMGVSFTPGLRLRIGG